MDPFVDVLEDAQQQEQNLANFIQKTRPPISSEADIDFQNNIQDLLETIQDLKESIESSRSDPDFFKISIKTISEREEIVHKLEQSIDSLQTQWNAKKAGATVVAQDGNNPFARYDDDPEAANAQFNAYQQQEMMREQDEHLDGVYASMQTINQQARAMGSELEEQAYILDELDGDLDRIGSKVGRGLKRVEHVIRANQERASDCCIGILILVLIILLVMIVVL